MIKQYLENLKALEEKASKAPWAAEEVHRYARVSFENEMRTNGVSRVCYSPGRNNTSFLNPQHLSNMQFIAASRTALPKLITMCEKLAEAMEIIANGKVETPYSAMHRHRLARTTLKELEGMVNENQS